MKHPIHFVGAGPGDPELITVKGQRLLQMADRVVYAGSLVPETLLCYCTPTVEKFSSAGLTLDQTHALLADGYHRELRVVRLHTGDPALYGAIHEQMVLLDLEGIPYEVVPGISAAFAAAAALKQELTLPEVSQTVILTRLGGRTPVPENEQLRLLAQHQATLVIYLSVQNLADVVTELQPAYPPDTPVVVAYRIGWPDQRLVIGTIQDIAERVQAAGITRQALIMVGAVFGARDAAGDKRSQLYHEAFQHGYRGLGTVPTSD
jgi:precorrin-4/cobalt-precorrin-4 C11-methyltransferase